MVILITGASHTGKTLLAQRLLERYHVPYLSLDHLKMGLIRSGNTELTPEDDDRLTAYLWPIAREIIKTAIENSQNLIVEGCYVPYHWRVDFDSRYQAAICFICLAMSDSYLDRYFGDVKRYACAIESRLEDFSCTVDWLKAENRKVREGFQRWGEPVSLIETDYKQTIDGILKEGVRALEP